MLVEVDTSKRAAYELRASHSDPALEAADESKQLTP